MLIRHLRAPIFSASSLSSTRAPQAASMAALSASRSVCPAMSLISRISPIFYACSPSDSAAIRLYRRQGWRLASGVQEDHTGKSPDPRLAGGSGLLRSGQPDVPSVRLAAYKLTKGA